MVESLFSNSKTVVIQAFLTNAAVPPCINYQYDFKEDLGFDPDLCVVRSVIYSTTTVNSRLIFSLYTNITGDCLCSFANHPGVNNINANYNRLPFTMNPLTVIRIHNKLSHSIQLTFKTCSKVATVTNGEYALRQLPTDINSLIANVVLELEFSKYKKNKS